jgi:hypothetical protein
LRFLLPGYYTKHEQDMQSMISEQARKAEELIRAIVNQAKVHCRRDTLWQRLQQSPASSSTNLTYFEFRELLTLSHREPISSGEPQLVPLLAQPVSWYQGLAKLLLSRYPENHRHYSSADGKIQYVIVLNQRLPGTAMMLSCDVLADKAVSVWRQFHCVKLVCQSTTWHGPGRSQPSKRIAEWSL